MPPSHEATRVYFCGEYWIENVEVRLKSSSLRRGKGIFIFSFEVKIQCIPFWCFELLKMHMANHRHSCNAHNNMLILEMALHYWHLQKMKHVILTWFRRCEQCEKPSSALFWSDVIAIGLFCTILDNIIFNEFDAIVTIIYDPCIRKNANY